MLRLRFRAGGDDWTGAKESGRPTKENIERCREQKRRGSNEKKHGAKEKTKQHIKGEKMKEREGAGEEGEGERHWH